MVARLTSRHVGADARFPDHTARRPAARRRTRRRGLPAGSRIRRRRLPSVRIVHGWLAERTDIGVERSRRRCVQRARRSYFRDAGWGTLNVGTIGDVGRHARLSRLGRRPIRPSAREHPACHLTTGMFADLFGRVAGAPVAVLEVECRSAGHAALPLSRRQSGGHGAVYDEMGRGSVMTRPGRAGSQTSESDSRIQMKSEQSRNLRAILQFDESSSDRTSGSAPTRRRPGSRGPTAARSRSRLRARGSQVRRRPVRNETAVRTSLCARVDHRRDREPQRVAAFAGLVDDQDAASSDFLRRGAEHRRCLPHLRVRRRDAR